MSEAKQVVYFVRTQGHGVHWDSPFATSPSKAQVAVLLQKDCEAHGQDRKTGAENTHWAKVLAVPLTFADSSESAADHTEAKFEGKRAAFPKAKSQGVAAKGEIAFEGQGRVVNPGDPEHMVLTAADVGTLDVTPK